MNVAHTDVGHKGPVLEAGAPLTRATAAMIMLHGRGATAENILGFANGFAQPDIAYLAPQARGRSWYPQHFMQPLAENEPYLTRALATLEALLASLETKGFGRERVVLLGFSQGACLSLEFAARNARRYGGVVALSGGLIGPPGTPFDYSGAVVGTPVFLGCSDVDPYIPLPRVNESAEVMRRLGGTVTERVYPGIGHVVTEDEVRYVRGLLARLTAASATAS